MNMIIWVARLALALFFFLDGAAKLTGDAAVLNDFISWGLPNWSMYVAGILEIIFGLGLLLKKQASRSAFWLSIMMFFAAIVSLNNNENILPPAILAAICFYLSVRLRVKKE